MSFVLTVRNWRYLFLISILSLLVTSSMTEPIWAQEEDTPSTEAAVQESTVETAATESAESQAGYALDNSMLFLTGILVFFMQAGFALVETGFNASKNAVNILFKNTMDFCIGSVCFFMFGFAMMYPGNYGIDVNAKPYFATGGYGLYTPAADHRFSPEVDWLFQCMFAATAATIVSGAVAGRIKIGAYFIYSAVISAYVYPISGYWVWGMGWLKQFGEFTDGAWSMGFKDFAGSGVVHMVGGFAGLAGAILLGPRIGKFVNGKPIAMPGHSLPLACLGVFILWLGWYGFNPGSQLAFKERVNIDMVMHVALTTTLAASVGGLSGTFLSWILFGKPDLGLCLNGILGGLVGITANCDCVSAEWAMFIGFVAGAIVIAGIVMLDKLGIDDPVGAFPVHGMCGMWGCLAIGIVPNDHLEAGTTSLKIQLIGVLAIAAWAFINMFILFSILKAIDVFRAPEDEELKGLDVSEHGMQAYQA